MSDLVERLRKDFIREKEMEDLIEEAADRIEELEAELNRMMVSMSNAINEANGVQDKDNHIAELEAEVEEWRGKFEWAVIKLREAADNE